MAKALNILDFSMSANGSFQLPVEGSYFRILTCTGNVAVIGDTFGKLGPINRGQGLENTEFRRLTIQDTSGLSNSGTILVSEANFIDQTLNGAVSVTNNLTIRPELSTGSFKTSGVLAANTAEQIFSAASNTNGAVILSASWNVINSTTYAYMAMLAKATAPASPNDGEVFSYSQSTLLIGTAVNENVSINSPQIVAPGLGLYFISGNGLSGGGYRACRYKLL